MLGSNNEFPSILTVEQGSTPTTPAAGHQRLFVRSSDGHLCRVDDGGDVTDVESGASGGTAISTDLGFEALRRGLQGEGVIAGCTPTAQGSPDMTVAIAAGVVRIGNLMIPVTGANATIGTADTTDPRIDIISINSSGTIVVTAGTAAPSPTAPTLPASSALIAQISIPANDTTISSGQITDTRIVLSDGGWAIVVAAADQDISSNTVLQNDNELFFTMAANALYEWELHLAYSSPSGGGTPDFKYAFTGPATLTGQYAVTLYPATNDSLTGAMAQAALSTVSPIGTATTARFAFTRGWASSTAGGSGSSGFLVQWAQNTSGLNASRREAGSFLRYRRIL